MYKYLKFFEELSINDIPEVGGKNASLGEMYHHLRPKELICQMVWQLLPMPIAIF